jgi:hypothetical protein
MSEHKSAAKENDFLVTVARSIGSTLGSVAAKVSHLPGVSRATPVRRKRVSKRSSAAGRTRSTTRKAAARKPKGRKKSSK